MARQFTYRKLAPAVMAGLLLLAAAATAPAADLFYNYYVPGNGAPPAQLYLSPRPTPPLVGHTYVTYQPFYPHEMLYPHRRTYYRCDGRHLLPMNVTTVSWRSGLLGGHIWWPHRHPEIQLMKAP